MSEHGVRARCMSEHGVRARCILGVYYSWGWCLITGSIRDYRLVLPEGLRDVSRCRWIPWTWIRRNYSNSATGPLVILFDAYQMVSALSDMDVLLQGAFGETADMCKRCGTCCAVLNPGFIDQERYRSWNHSGTLTGRFFQESPRPGASGSWYAGWYHNGIRLRMCPLLYYCPEHDSHWCAVYHLGPGHRPEACETFHPNPPHCEVSQRPLVP